MGSAGMNFMNIGKNKAHIYAETGQEVIFKDAAGVDEAKQELEEVIEFLRKPEHFQQLEGVCPKECFWWVLWALVKPYWPGPYRERQEFLY
jgi:ATP-dependent Zn protease